MKTYNFVYKTLFNDGHYYIGQHKTDNLDDNYFGSSKIVKNMIKNHPELEPKREILRFCDTQDELNYWEKYYIADNWKEDELCLNDNCTCAVTEMTEARKLQISNKLTGIIFTDEHRKNISKSLQGISFSEERNLKISKSLKDKQK